jgi:iron complex outermembrane receptor protein
VAKTKTSFEAGVKADLFNRRASLAFGVFSYTIKDLQLTAVGGAANANILLSAKKATVPVRAGGQGLPDRPAVGQLGVGFNDTRSRTGPGRGRVRRCKVTGPADRRRPARRR